MNHTRFPKGDHLPDWTLQDNKVTQGDRVGREQEKGRNGFQEIVQISCLGCLKTTKGRMVRKVWKWEDFPRNGADVLGVKWVAYVCIPACWNLFWWRANSGAGMVVRRLWVPTSISGLSLWDEDGQFGPGTNGYLPPFPACACLSLCTLEHGNW